MPRFDFIENFSILINKLPFIGKLEDFGISRENLIEILKYLQFLVIKLKIGKFPKFKKIQKIKEIANKLTLFENYLYEQWSEKNYESEELYLNSLGIIATLYDFIGKIIIDENYIIKSAILYCLSEFEPNSRILINNFFAKNYKYQKLINFDCNTDDIKLISSLDLIILLNILFFSRNFPIIEKFLKRNKEILSYNKDFNEWILFFQYIIEFINTGQNKEKIMQIFTQIYSNRVKYTNPLLFWIINRLKIHISSFFKNSIWILNEKLPNIHKNYIQELIKSEIFELWKSQRNCIDLIKDFRKNNIFLMPTSSGKTLIAEIQSLYHFFNKKKKVLYICPTNALVNQIYQDHRVRFSKLGINILRLSGSYEQIYEFDIFLLEYSALIIITPEKFDLLFRTNYIRFLEQFSLIIFDEFQLIEDSQRGLKYELLISRLINSIASYNLDISITLLSACVPYSTISPILNWLGAANTRAINIEWKPTRIIEAILVDDKTNPNIHGIVFPNLEYSIKSIFKEENLPTIEDKLIFFIRYLKKFSPIMIFYENKEGCERIVKKIYQQRNLLEINEILDPYFKNQIELIKNELGYETELIDFLKFGLAFHHSGLPESIKDIIQLLIKKGFISIFACTTTFAEGVNFPVQLIFFHSLNLYNEDTGKMELLSFRLYENIIGRAGRALRFNEGFIFIPDKEGIPFNFINLDLEPIKSIFEILKEEIFEDTFEKLLNKKVISDLQVDLLSYENLDNLNIEVYLKNTFYYQKNQEISLNIKNHLEKEKNFIKNFNYPKNTKEIFKNSGLNLLFCSNLYNYIINNNFATKFEKYNLNSLIKSEEFENINEWIFKNHPELSDLDNFYFKIIETWINREKMNFEEILKYCNYDEEKFSKTINFLNKKIRYIYPWMWSIIIKLLKILNSKLIKIDLIPYFIKFGVNSKEKLIEIIYEANMEVIIENEKLSKDKIRNLIS